jgi:hypothetical protein
MNKNIISIVILLFFLVLGITATAEAKNFKNDSVVCYDGETITNGKMVDMIAGRYNATLKNTPTLNVTCLQGKCIEYKSASSEFAIPINNLQESLFTPAKNLTFIAWINPNSTGATQTIFGSASTTKNFQMARSSTGLWAPRVDSTAAVISDTFKPMPVNVWNMVVVTVRVGGNFTLYNNATIKSPITGYGTNNFGDTPPWTVASMNITGTGQVDFFNGRIDTLVLLKGVPTPTNITAIWNNSVGVGCSYFVPTQQPIIIVTNFTVNTTDYIQGLRINTFNVTVTNKSNGVTRTFATTTGKVITSFKKTGYLVNATVRGIKYYFNGTTININVSKNLVQNVTPYMKLRARNNRNNTNITAFNVTIDGLVFNSNISNGDLRARYFGAIKNLIFSAPRYNNINYTNRNTSKLTFVGNLTPYMKVRAKEIYDQANLTTLNATISGIEYTSQPNGNLYLPFGGKLKNITFRAPLHFPKTLINKNTSTSTLIVNLSQVQAIMQGILTIANTTINGGTFFTQLRNGTTLFLPARKFNITFVKTGYYNKTKEFNFTALQNTTFQIRDIYTSIFNISAKKNSDGSPINIFTIIINLKNTTLTSNSFRRTMSTTNGIARVPVINGTYNISISAPGYASDIVNSSISSLIKNIVFSLYIRNTIIFNIFDEETITRIMQNITVSSFTSNATRTSSTKNGTLIMGNLTSGLYRNDLSGANYTTRTYYATMASASHIFLNVYLLRTSSGQNYKINIKNSRNNLVENVDLTITKLVAGNFVTVAQKNTGVLGFANFFLKPASVYRIQIVASGYTTRILDLEVAPSDTEYTIYLQDQSTVNFQNFLRDVTYSISPTTNTLSPTSIQNFSLTVSSPSGLIDYFGVFGAGQSSNVTGSVAGGTSIINTSTIGMNRTSLVVKFTFRLSNGELFKTNRTYYIYNLQPGNYSAQTFVNNYKSQIPEFYRVIIAIILSLLAGALFYSLLGTLGSTAIATLVFISFGISTFIPMLFPVITSILVFLGYLATGGGEP